MSFLEHAHDVTLDSYRLYAKTAQKHLNLNARQICFFFFLFLSLSMEKQGHCSVHAFLSWSICSSPQLVQEWSALEPPFPSRNLHNMSLKRNISVRYKHIVYTSRFPFVCRGQSARGNLLDLILTFSFETRSQFLKTIFIQVPKNSTCGLAFSRHDLVPNVGRVDE